MALLLLILTAIPTVTGTAQAISAQKRQNEELKEKIPFFLTTTFTTKSGKETEVYITLKEGKMYLDHPKAPVDGFRFSGYYFNYPGTETKGLVSFTAKDPPALGWVFVDKDTFEVRYGMRSDSLGHLIGPWGWTPNEAKLILQGDERFVAVVGIDGLWRLCYDKNGDGSGLPEGKIVDISLQRHPQLGVGSSYVR